MTSSKMGQPCLKHATHKWIPTGTFGLSWSAAHVLSAFTTKPSHGNDDGGDDDDYDLWHFSLSLKGFFNSTIYFFWV